MCPDSTRSGPSSKSEPIQYEADEARRMRINLSETLERRLRSIVRAEQEKRWRDENQEAFASINAFVERHGLLASRLRYRADS